MRPCIKRRTTGMWLVLLPLFFVALISGCTDKPKKQPAKVGEPAPEFTLKQVGGKTVNLSDYRGKVVMLEFFTTWCPPCRLSVPELNEVHEKYADKDFVIVAISMDEDIDIVKSFMEEYGIEYPVLFDDKGVSDDYAIYTIPSTVIIDKDGIYIKHHTGYAPGIYESLIDDIRDQI